MESLTVSLPVPPSESGSKPPLQAESSMSHFGHYITLGSPPHGVEISMVFLSVSARYLSGPGALPFLSDSKISITFIIVDYRNSFSAIETLYSGKFPV